MASHVKWTEDLTKKLLTECEKHVCLWDSYSESYKNEILRDNAYAAIEKTLNISINDVKLKIKNIRSSYSTELKKVKMSKKSGAGTNEVYVPKVFWFSIVDTFLRRVMTPQKTFSNMEIENEPPDSNHSLPSTSTDLGLQEEECQVGTELPPPAELTVSHPGKRITTQNKFKKRKLDSDIIGAVDKLHEISKTARQSIPNQSGEDEFDAFAKMLATQLRQMPLILALETQIKLQTVINAARIQNLLSSSHDNQGSSPSWVSVSSNSPQYSVSSQPHDGNWTSAIPVVAVQEESSGSNNVLNHSQVYLVTQNECTEDSISNHDQVYLVEQQTNDESVDEENNNFENQNDILNKAVSAILD